MKEGVSAANWPLGGRLNREEIMKMVKEDRQRLSGWWGRGELGCIGVALSRKRNGFG